MPRRWFGSASVLHSNGDGIDIAVRDGRIVGVRGRARDRVNRGRLDPKDFYGWQANHSADRLTRPLVREGGRLVECDWDTAMGRIVERSKALLDEPGGWGRIGFYTTGQLFLEEYYTLAVIGKAGIGTPHMDGNTRLCTATAAAALKASFGSDGQPGVLHGHRSLRRDRALRPQRRRDAGRAVDADARPPARRRPAADAVRGPARHAGRARGRHPPGAARGHEPRAAERPAARAAAARVDRRATGSPSTRSASRSSSAPSTPYTPERVREICGVAPAQLSGGGRADRHRRARWSRPCCRASTSPTRRPPRRARSTTSTCCAA